jgi:hypothetical protein
MERIINPNVNGINLRNWFITKIELPF